MQTQGGSRGSHGFRLVMSLLVVVLPYKLTQNSDQTKHVFDI